MGQKKNPTLKDTKIQSEFIVVIVLYKFIEKSFQVLQAPLTISFCISGLLNIGRDSSRKYSCPFLAGQRKPQRQTHEQLKVRLMMWLYLFISTLSCKTPHNATYLPPNSTYLSYTTLFRDLFHALEFFTSPLTSKSKSRSPFHWTINQIYFPRNYSQLIYHLSEIFFLSIKNF